MRLILEVHVFSGLITNCNHKLVSRWCHINAATSVCGAKQAFQRHNETDMDGLDVHIRQGVDKRWKPEDIHHIHGEHIGERGLGRHPC